MERQIRIKEISTASALTRSRLPELKYAFNPYLGCLHGCVYCYAMDFTNDREAAENWGSVIAVKANIMDPLRREVGRMPRGVVGVSTVTDPYQPVEGKYRLTRRGIDMLSTKGFRVSIQTRSPMFVRDLDIMGRNPGMFDVGMTIATPSAQLTELIEPGAPPPRARFSALQKASDEGLVTWIFLGPVIRGFNDTEDQISDIIDFASGTGSRIIYDRFSPYRGATGLMEKVLPGRKEDYMGSSGREWWKSISTFIEDKSRKSGVRCNAQADDWKYEKARLVRPLTDFMQ